MSKSDHLQVHDITDLKERISKLKEIHKQRVQERQQYEAKIIEKEELLQKMKQEYTVLAPDLELRYNNTTTEAASAVLNQSQAIGSPAALQLGDTIIDRDLIDDRRFRIWNEKLEMQILLQEIRQVLPSLEEQAKFYERRTEHHRKHVIKSEMKATSQSDSTMRGAQRQQNSRIKTEEKQVEDETEDNSSKPLLVQSTDECKESIDRAVSEIADLKRQRLDKLEQQKHANQTLIEKLKSLREEIREKREERLSLQKTILRAQKDSLLEEKRKAVVPHEFLRLRRECEEKDQYLWQTAIFRQETGSDKGRIPISRIPPVLSKWLLIKNDRIPWKEKEYLVRLISEVKEDMQRGGRGSESKMEGKEEKQEEPDDAHDIDLLTFCLLCNQLILLLE